jgi:hypothetical protein
VLKMEIIYDIIVPIAKSPTNGLQSIRRGSVSIEMLKFRNTMPRVKAVDLKLGNKYGLLFPSAHCPSGSLAVPMPGKQWKKSTYTERCLRGTGTPDGRAGVTEEVKRPKSLAFVRIPRLKKKRVTSFGRVPAMAVEREELVQRPDDQNQEPVAAREATYGGPDSVQGAGQVRPNPSHITKKKLSLATEAIQGKPSAPTQGAEEKPHTPGLSRRGKTPDQAEIPEERPTVPVRDTEAESIHPDPDSVEKSLAPSEEKEQTAEVVVTVVPTPRKRQTNSPRPEPESAVSSGPKLVKVIRRRREQAPIVFETAKSSVPEAMLKGVKTDSEEDGESSRE